MSASVKTGKVAGTGTAITINVGWKPDHIRCFNYDDAGNLFPVFEWFSGMPDGSAVKTMSITDNGATGNKSLNRITTGGISMYAGTAGVDAPGFIIGTDADMNVNGENIYWVASRNIN